MGQIQNLTKEQRLIFLEVAGNELFQKRFYFTGGTALSAFYLQHRYSDDLDFFTPDKLHTDIISEFMEACAKKHAFTFQSRFVEVVYIFQLTFSDTTTLKVDFAYYPHKLVEEGKSIEKLRIDSLLDIAINKIVTISQRTDVKDFVDLYFLLKTCSLWDLMYGAKVKFRREINPFILSVDFLKVEDFTFLPKMIKPLTLEELKRFFREQAKTLARKSFD